MSKSKTQLDNKPARRSTKASRTTPEQKPVEALQRPGGKLGVIVDRLTESGGATADELAEATGWQKHTVLGALSRLRSRGFAMRLETEQGRKAYRLDRAEG
jgi:hypothetical protein